MKYRGNLVSEDRFYDVSNRPVNDIFDANQQDSWVHFRSILDSFFDQGEIKRALDPAMLCAKRI